MHALRGDRSGAWAEWTTRALRDPAALRCAIETIDRCRPNQSGSRPGRRPRCRPGRAPAASSAAQDCCIRRTLQKSPEARTATPSRRGDSGRRSVGRSSSDRRGDVVLTQPQRCGAQQAAIAMPSRPGSAEQQSVLRTPRCCSRPEAFARRRPPACLLSHRSGHRVRTAAPGVYVRLEVPKPMVAGLRRR